MKLSRLLALAALFAASTVQAAAARPNIVFIMADDLGYTDLGCFGSGYYETPNIDRLAAQGLKLTNFHQCQNCAPTRAALMSGQLGPRTGVYTVGGINRFNWQSRPLRPVDNVTELPLDRDIIAKQLKAAGYATGMFGKWHLGQKGDFLPGKRGFDEAIVSAGRHYKFTTIPSIKYPEGTYLADFLTDRAVDFITRHKDRPFFLYLPHFGVHSPYQAKTELIEKFKRKAPVGGHHDPTYAAMIASVDESVGRVMKTLDDLRLADNTVLIFTSDNGGVGGYGRPDGIIRVDGGSPAGKKKTGNSKKDNSGVTDNAPLRSGKGSLYEGGVRVPFIVRWPGVTQAGAACDTPAIHVDMFPTLLEIADAPKPRQFLDGTSVAGLFRDPSAQLSRDAIFQHFPGYLGFGPGGFRTTPVTIMQRGDWKLMEYHEDGHLELYNLKDDIGESNNLAESNAQLAGEMHRRMLAWRKQIKAPMPTKNTPHAAPKKGKGQGKGNKKAKAK